MNEIKKDDIIIEDEIIWHTGKPDTWQSQDVPAAPYAYDQYQAFANRTYREYI